MAAMIPRITITANSSISVKPFSIFVKFLCKLHNHFNPFNLIVFDTMIPLLEPTDKATHNQLQNLVSHNILQHITS